MSPVKGISTWEAGLDKKERLKLFEKLKVSKKEKDHINIYNTKGGILMIKKLLILIFVLNSTLLIGQWEAVYRRDEFYDMTDTLDFLRYMEEEKDDLRLFYAPIRQYREEYDEKRERYF